MGNGEFEGQSLESLHAMLAGSDPAKLANAGNVLSDAAPKITEVGNYLRSHATRVEWRGEGADRFREWSHHFALEVMRLGEFTGAVGNHMVNAGQALTEAKAAVPKPVDAEKAHGDPDADKAHITDGTTKLQQAIHQMERLSSYYRAAKEDIAAEREPEFKVLPIHGSDFDSESPYRSEPGAARSAAFDSAGVDRQLAPGVVASGRTGEGAARGVGPGEHLGGPVRMGLDGMGQLSPSVRDLPPHVPVSVEASRLPEQSLPTVPARITPIAGPHTSNLPDQSGQPAPRVPPDGLPRPQQPAIRAKNQRLSDLPGVSGGRPRNASDSPRGSRLARGLTVGRAMCPLPEGLCRGVFRLLRLSQRTAISGLGAVVTVMRVITRRARAPPRQRALREGRLQARSGAGRPGIRHPGPVGGMPAGNTGGVRGQMAAWGGKG